MSDTHPTRDVTQPRPRPNAVWKCGLTDQGLACSEGPDHRGRCCRLTYTGQAECSQATTQQPCEGCATPCSQFEDASLPACIPIRNGWRFRHSLAISLGVLTGSILLILLALPERESTFVPGPLTSKHAQIISNKVVSERCGLCHPNSHSAQGQTNPSITQDELCSRCHVGQHKNIGLRSPHDIDRATLQKMSTEQRERRGRLVSFPSSGQDNLATKRDLNANSHQDTSEMVTNCASCHVEHHGRNHDLQAMADQRCQACHQSQFPSFNEGHPEFADYPQARDRRIAFSHRNHQNKHFSQKNQAFECASCHVDDRHQSGVGSVFRTVSFEVACASCHNEPIKAATVDGWTILQLPSIQAADTRQPNLGLSDWPSNAQYGYEGTIPLAMRTLLLADEEAIAVVRKIPNSGSLKDLPSFAEQGKATTLTVALATRKLIKDIANDGQTGWRNRVERVLQAALGRELGPHDLRLVDELCAGLPPDIFRQMERDWFKSDANVVSREPNPRSLTLKLASAQQQDDLLLGGSESKNDSLEMLDAPSKTNLKKQPKADDDLLPDFTKSQSSIRLDEPKASPSKQKLTKVRGAIHVVQGGWYLDNETLSVRYMPRGHADRTLAAWAELASILDQSRKSDTDIGESLASLESLPLPSQTTSNQTIVAGGCAVCHNLERQDVSGRIANGESVWMAYNRPPTVRELTKFDHTPHLTLPTLAKCTYCHQLNEEKKKSDYRRFVSTQPQSPGNDPQVTCEFKSMSLQQCVACHRPDGAGTGCIQCHNYHVSEPHAAK